MRRGDYYRRAWSRLCFVAVLIFAVVCLCLMMRWYSRGHAVPEQMVADTVRVVVHDTIRTVAPQPAQVTALPQVVRWLPRWREPRSEVRGTSDEAQDAIYMACGADTGAVDTVAVVVPMERKVYEDSTYRAVITGAWASLDTIEVYRAARLSPSAIPPTAAAGR